MDIGKEMSDEEARKAYDDMIAEAAELSNVILKDLSESLF